MGWFYCRNSGHKVETDTDVSVVGRKRKSRSTTVTLLKFLTPQNNDTNTRGAFAVLTHVAAFSLLLWDSTFVSCFLCYMSVFYFCFLLLVLSFLIYQLVVMFTWIQNVICVLDTCHWIQLEESLGGGISRLCTYTSRNMIFLRYEKKRIFYDIWSTMPRKLEIFIVLDDILTWSENAISDELSFLWCSNCISVSHKKASLIQWHASLNLQQGDYIHQIVTIIRVNE